MQKTRETLRHGHLRKWEQPRAKHTLQCGVWAGPIGERPWNMGWLLFMPWIIFFGHVLWASQVALALPVSAGDVQCKRCMFNPWVRKIPWRVQFFIVWKMHDRINSANTVSCWGVWTPYGSPMLHLFIPQNLTWNPWQLLNVLLFLKICIFQTVTLMHSYSM